MDHLGSSAWLEAAPEILSRRDSNNIEVLTAVSLEPRLLGCHGDGAKVEPCISGAAIQGLRGLCDVGRSQGPLKVERPPLRGRNPRARCWFLVLSKYSPKGWASVKHTFFFL